MKLSVVHAGLFKLDGGAMFGVVPKKMWHKLNPPDDQNMCTWATRCLLVQTGDRNILIDTGLGDKQDAKFRSHFSPHGDMTLLGSTEATGLRAEEITDVFITHFHFDHVGGAVTRTKDGKLVPTFPNATYWSNTPHFDWAYTPNPRERASFLKENFVPLKELGKLNMIDVEDGVEWLPGINVNFVYGHTEAMMLPNIQVGNKKVIFCADLIPSSHHIGLPYVMAYDVRPLETMKEKEILLTRALEEKAILFFEHDRDTECATLKRNERGRIVADQRMTLSKALTTD
ncbi:MAG: MBL fold metallo-hydrolase [Bacteroidota bacterium]